MFMEVHLLIRPEGGEEHQITAGPRDLLVWQKTSRGRTFGQLLPIREDGEGVNIEKLDWAEIYRLAHIVARREGLFNGQLKEFEEQVDVGLADVGGEVDPTNAAASAASSSTSPSAPASPRRSGPTKAPKRS